VEELRGLRKDVLRLREQPERDQRDPVGDEC
jgi:hypothetical protein